MPILGSQGSGVKIAPATPTVGTATVTNATTVSLTFTAPDSKLAITSYTATSSPSIALTTSGTTSPLTVTGTFAASQTYTFTITATNSAGTSSSSSASNSVTPLSYTLGGVGQGGGTIFYDAGSTLSWGRYLEVARTSTSPAWPSPDTQSAWMEIDTAVGLHASNAIGQGRANTTAILNAYPATTSNSAYRCRNYTGGGYSGAATGWFLGSTEEMRTLAFRNGNYDDVGSFIANNYDTSNETSINTYDIDGNFTGTAASAIDRKVTAFYTSSRGQSFNQDKQYGAYVRPIRAF